MANAKSRTGGLRDLLADLTEDVQQVPSVEPESKEPPVQPGTAPKAQQRRPKAPAASPPARSSFGDFERKEARLRQDQLDSLDALTKRIKRAKTGPGERITDNTLIRIAVDLLLSQAADLQGSTETELRNSVGL